MSKCEKVGDAIVCFPDTEEQINERLSELCGDVADILEYARQLEKQRFAYESGLVHIASQLLGLAIGLKDVHEIEKKLHVSCAEMKERLEEILDLRVEKEK